MTTRLDQLKSDLATAQKSKADAEEKKTEIKENLEKLKDKRNRFRFAKDGLVPKVNRAISELENVSSATSNASAKLTSGLKTDSKDDSSQIRNVKTVATRAISIKSALTKALNDFKKELEKVEKLVEEEGQKLRRIENKIGSLEAEIAKIKAEIESLEAAQSTGRS